MTFSVPIDYNIDADRDVLYTREIELTFKRHVMLPNTRAAFGRLFITYRLLKRLFMNNIFVYSDESGVFDKVHNDYFVFGGLIFVSKNERDIFTRKYRKAEEDIRRIESLGRDVEIKATTISNRSKGKLFRSMNQIEKFGIVVKQKEIYDGIFKFKKSKQRYLDWAFKFAVKNKLNIMIKKKVIVPEEIDNIYFFVDEHNTATDGIYELQESIEHEFKFGNYCYEKNIHHPPLFDNLKDVKVEYCNSKTKTLVRASDIVANRLYYMARINDYSGARGKNFDIIYHP